MGLAKDLAGAGGHARRPRARSGPAPTMWHYGFLFAPALTVGGGTGEVQRNIVAERVLGLPHDVGRRQTPAAGGFPPSTTPQVRLSPMSVLEAIELRRHEKVRANIDLPACPPA